MLLRSLIKDEGIVTFECAKAKMGKGDTIDIPDLCWLENEIQGAIKLKLVEVVGEPPKVSRPESQKAAEEPKKKFVSAAKTKLAFDCIKDYVDPGGNIWIPMSKISEMEVQNALGWGLIVDPEAKSPPQKPAPNEPAVLQEAVLSARPRQQPKKSNVAKSIKRASEDSVPVGPAAETEENSLFAPSELRVPKVETRQAKEAPAAEEAAAPKKKDGRGFMEIFGVEANKATAKAQSDDEEI